MFTNAETIFLQGRCNRDKPPCKYFHPPQHLKDQLLINGRNHLALKNALLQQMGLAPGQPMVPSQVPALVSIVIRFSLFCFYFNYFIGASFIKFVIIKFCNALVSFSF